MATEQGPPSELDSYWKALLAEADELGAEYEDDGWEVLVIHPGDVTPIDGEDFGLDVLAPGDEFEAVEELLEQATFDTSHVYHKSTDSLGLFVTVFEATGTETVVVVPIYATEREMQPLVTPATQEGEMRVHVRPLSDDQRVTFTVADQSLFFDVF